MKVDFRFVATIKPNSDRLVAAQWLRSNKLESLDNLVRGWKHEIIADNGATPAQIHAAKVESAAFFRYMAEVLGAQIAIERGELPAAVPIVAQGLITASAPPPPASSPAPSVDEEEDDDDEFFMDID